MKVASPEVEIERILEPILDAPVECDGFVQMAAYLLEQQGRPYEIWCGRLVLAGGRCVEPHFWLMVEGLIVDYRARCWVESAPHGVFKPGDGFDYQGRVATVPLISEALFKAMGLKVDWSRQEGGPHAGG